MLYERVVEQLTLLINEEPFLVDCTYYRWLNFLDRCVRNKATVVSFPVHHYGVSAAISRHGLHHVEVSDKLAKFDRRQVDPGFEASLTVCFLPIPRQILNDVSHQLWWLIERFRL